MTHFLSRLSNCCCVGLQLQRSLQYTRNLQTLARSGKSGKIASGFWKKWKGTVYVVVGCTAFGTSIYYIGTMSPESILSTSLCEKGSQTKFIETNVKKIVFVKGQEMTLQERIAKARDVIHKVKDEVGTPGLVVGVSVDGQVIWKEGFGYSDVENRVPCTPDTVMRIASISKPMTMAALAKLWEESKLDLDKPVQYYVPSYPEKTVDGEKVVITPRHLVSHMSGIRHYKKISAKEAKDQANHLKQTAAATTNNNNNNNNSNNNIKKDSDEKSRNGNDSVCPEMYIKDKYEKVEDALALFKDEPLSHKPGTKYLYTTHGFTLLSAVVEAAAKVPFATHMKNTFAALGLNKTYLDENEPIIYNRSRYYQQKNNRVINAPYVDNSYKWAGGGFLSTVGDLLHFGNAMLYSYQYTPASVKECDDNETKNNDREDKGTKKPGFLKSETVKMLWTPVIATPTRSPVPSSWYGMGWGVGPEQKECEFCRHQQFFITHSGGAIGASSVMVIIPKQETHVLERSLPRGVVVSMITNLTSVGLGNAAKEIAALFQDLE